MRGPEHGQAEVVNAIYELDSGDVYKDLLNVLHTNVFEAYLILAGPDHRSPGAWGSKPMASRREREQAFQNAVSAWIASFRLTDSGTPGGKPLPWMVAEAKNVCERRYRRTFPDDPDGVVASFSANYARTLQWGEWAHFMPSEQSEPVPLLRSPEEFWTLTFDRAKVPGPKLNESFERFWSRTEGSIRKAARDLHNSTRPTQAPQPRRKRVSAHYQWFVLRRFAGWAHRKIADRLSREEKTLAEDTVRKGVGLVTQELGLRATGN